MSDRHDTDPRVPLAMERTFLAWIRTGLAMMGFGFVIARFAVFLGEMRGVTEDLSRPVLSLFVGTAFVGLGVIATIYAAARFHSDLRALEAGAPFTPRKWVPITIAAAMALIGIATVWYFLTNA